MPFPVERIRLGPGAEFDLIRRFLAAAEKDAPSAAGVLVGPGDDCAILRAGTLAISMDGCVEGVHFRREWLTPVEIGWRAAAAAPSDLAAVAARPIGVLATVACPPDDVPDFASQVVEGLVAAAHASGAALLGGDVTASPAAMFLDVVVVGDAPDPVLRSTARPGQSIWVTGALGGAAAAVRAWQGGAEPPPGAREAFARPRPRIAEALWLRERGLLRAMLDLSDGLAGDAAHLAAASGVGVVIDRWLVPVAEGARAVASDDADALHLALSGGEDYELCFTAEGGAVEPVIAEFERAFGTPLTRVGEVREGRGVARREPDGSVGPLDETGYRHFEAGGGS